jgi:archaellum biogenesis ATPase FlaH
MFRKEVNERSPMRVFESSIHGGLGKGNVGVVVSRPGRGKSALLVQIALDDLLRDRKVLHISHEHAVDHVRSYYDEIFHDLAHATQLEAPESVRTDIERNRLILSHLGHQKSADRLGMAASLKKIRDSVSFARELAHFEPDVLLVDGFDFEAASVDDVKALRVLARELGVELWTSATVQKTATKPDELTGPIERFKDLMSVIVSLAYEKPIVKIYLLKDHDNADVASLHLRLDAHSMRVIDEDVRTPSERPRDPRRFTLQSGGARGTEAEFGACAEEWGVVERNYSFEGHRLLARQRGVVVLSEAELQKGDFSLKYVSKRLGRVLSDVPLVRNVLQTIWHQVSAAQQVFVVGSIQPDGTVRGGTGWGAELARLWKKPLFVYDQTKDSWFSWSGAEWELAVAPVIQSESFAGTGTQELTEKGREAVRDLFLRSFGAPS